jgi:arginyl-tRNA synthetase
LQYTHVRLRALEEKFAEKFGALPEALSGEATLALHTADCAHLVALLERYPATLRQAATELEPAVISRFLLELAEGFNTFYSSGTRVLSDDEAATRARIALVVAVRRTLAHGLTLLGVPCPARM